MNYRNKFISALVKLTALAVVPMASLLLLNGTAKAADPPIPTNTIPSAGDFQQGSSVALIAAIYGNGYVLRSPDSTVRLYSPSQTNEITIVNGGNCPGQGGDVGPNNSEATTTYRVYALIPDNGNPLYNNTPFLGYSPALNIYGGRDYITNRDIGCNSTFKFTTANPYGNVDSGPAAGKWGFEIRATMSGPPGWNQYKYQVTNGGGRLSYFAGSGDHFAIKDAGIPTNSAGNYNFGFAPGCKLQQGDTTDATLKWFDEDAGESNQNGESPVVTEIIEYDANNNPTGYTVPIVSLSGATNGGFGANGNRLINITSGNDVPGSATIKIRGHHKYQWRHYHIWSGNGIQFQLPYDSFNTMINFNSDCPQPYAASCTTNPSSLTGLSPNQTVNNIQVTVTNTGSIAWDPNSSPTINIQKFANGVNQGSINLSASSTGGNNVAPNGKTIFTFNNATAPSTINSTKTLTFRMFTGSTLMGGANICKTLLSTGACPLSGCVTGPNPSIAADCSTTTVTIPKSSILATWHPPPNTHTSPAPYPKIGFVPVQIVVLDGGNPIGSTNGSVDVRTSDGIFRTSTFGLAPGMWPHKNYDIHLIVKGTQAQDSATYNNDGNWAAAYTAVDFNTEPGVGDCLHLECAGTLDADVEPGQTAPLSAGIKFNNDTQQPYALNSTGGYYMHVDASGGIVGAPGDPAPTNGQINGGPGSNTVSAVFNARVDSRGTYSVTFMFQGSPLDLGQGNPCPDQTVTPATKPFLQVWGGDVNTGGGFETQDPVTGAFSCTTPPYNDYPYYVSPSSPATGGDPNYAGIKAFGYTDVSGTHGSLSDFGALSLGQIVSNSAAKINFGAQPKFSNTASPNYGQLDSTPPDYCVTNFFDDGTQKTPAPLSIPPPGQLSDLSGSATDQYVVNNQNVDSFLGGTVAAGRRITLYVNGDITIKSNIVYANWDPNNSDTAPSFTLIVKGNINIDPNVTRVDGLYIAQPSAPRTDGEFNTCANNSGNQFCNQQLVANGAVIARIIKPLRSAGTVSADACPGYLSFPCADFHKPAEIFNFIPSMVIGPPNFAPAYNSLQGLFNLPPVF
jgi:hypothetical protein